MSKQANIIIDNGQEFVETDYGRFALGLNLPPVKTQAFPTLATKVPLLSLEEIKRLIESETFEFGRKRFDSSWITNQNGYGSCAAYGGSSALAKARVLGGQERVDLSGDYLYSLVNGGRDSGSMLDDNMYALMSKGVCKRETVPLGGIYRNKYNTAVADREALRFRAHESYAIPDEQSMATALALPMPVVIAIHVTRDWRRFDGDDILAPANGPGNHCEHLDDIKWSAKRGCFLYRKATSHGVSYSDDGYCWTTWEDHYKQTSRYHQFYAVPAAIQDPQGDNPNGSESEDNRPLDVPTVVRTSSPGCVWCKRWEDNELPKLKQAGWKLVDGQVPGSGVPRFDLRVGVDNHIHTGFWSFADMERKAAELQR